MTTTVAMLYPGHAAEDDYARIEQAINAATLADEPLVRLPVVISEIDSDAHTVAAMLAVGADDRLAEAAGRARAHEPDVVMWACTSGSFLYGWDGAHRQVAELAKSTGLPTGSTSLAFATACAATGLSRVAIAATYPEAVAARFTDFLADAGVEVVASVPHDVDTATAAGSLDDGDLTEMVRSSDSARAQAILVPDTALHTAAAVPALERAAGKPVLTANQVTTWYGLRLAGVGVQVSRLGSLFDPAHQPTPPDR